MLQWLSISTPTPMRYAASGSSRVHPTATSTVHVAIRSWSPPRLPSYGSSPARRPYLRKQARHKCPRSASSNAPGHRTAFVLVETLVDTLVQLMLLVQSLFLLLRASVQAHMAHSMQTVHRGALVAHIRRTAAASAVDGTLVERGGSGCHGKSLWQGGPHNNCGLWSRFSGVVKVLHGYG